jgi:hypothetical protein
MTEKLMIDEYTTDSPETRDQAEALLKQYYKEHRGEKDFPRRYNLASWRLNPGGTMTVVDGASGRKLVFTVDEKAKIEKAQLEAAEDAEEAVLDAEAEAKNAEAQALEAQAKLKQAKEEATPKPATRKKAKS